MNDHQVVDRIQWINHGHQVGKDTLMAINQIKWMHQWPILLIIYQCPAIKLSIVSTGHISGHHVVNHTSMDIMWLINQHFNTTDTSSQHVIEYRSNDDHINCHQMINQMDTLTIIM